MNSDIREEVLSRNLYMCEYKGCTRRAIEVAHRIAKTKENIAMAHRVLIQEFNVHMNKKLVIDIIIDNPINLAASCREHNDYFNTGYDTMAFMAVVKKFLDNIYGDNTNNNNNN